jgi:hypothetical protein
MLLFTIYVVLATLTCLNVTTQLHLINTNLFVYNFISSTCSCTYKPLNEFLLDAIKCFVREYVEVDEVYQRNSDNEENNHFCPLPTSERISSKQRSSDVPPEKYSGFCFVNFVGYAVANVHDTLERNNKSSSSGQLVRLRQTNTQRAPVGFHQVIHR